jgi:hypothetical protein
VIRKQKTENRKRIVAPLSSVFCFPSSAPQEPAMSLALGIAVCVGAAAGLAYGLIVLALDRLLGRPR